MQDEEVPGEPGRSDTPPYEGGLEMRMGGHCLQRQDPLMSNMDQGLPEDALQASTLLQSPPQVQAQREIYRL
jgi:hypothetical protein